MTESLGTARLDIEVGLGDFEAKLSRARNIAAGFGTEVEAAFDKTTGKAKNAADSLLRYVNNMGLSVDQTKLLTAAIKGVDATIIDSARAKMDAFRQSEALAVQQALELGESWKAMQAKAKAAFADLKFQSNKEAMEADERAAAQLAAANERLAIDAANAAREQQRVFASLSAQGEAYEAQQIRLGSQRAFIENLERQSAAIGKTRVDLLEMEAAEKGVADQAAPFIAQLRAQEQALVRGGTQFNQYGLSAKQTAAALRQVPAQMTDIIVSLQSGQAPLTVLLQQGGQLKDVFGGVVPAVKALGGALLDLLLNPVVLLAGGLAAVTAAFVEGENETTAYNKAVILTGNYAGKTAGELQVMAVAIRGVNDTQHDAAAAVAAVAASGKFAGEQFQVVAKAALDMQRATGTAISKTVDQFASLAKDPTKAVLKLNEETHFLTNTVFEQIKSLQEQGRTQEAATLAMNAYADAVEQRTNDVEGNLGTLQTAWRGVATVAKAAWDAMLDIGRDKGLDEQLIDMGTHIADLKDQIANPSWLTRMSAGGIGGIESLKAQLKAAQTDFRALAREQTNQNRVDASDAAKQQLSDYQNQVSTEITAHQTAAEKLKAAITKARGELAVAEKNAIAAGNAAIIPQLRANEKQLEATLNAEHAKKGASTANAQSKADLQDFKDILAQEEAAISNSRTLLEAQYGAKLLTAKDYYAQMRALASRDLTAQENALTGEIASLKARNVTGKDAIDVTRQIGQLESQLAIARMKGATAAQILTMQEQQANRQREDSIDSYKRALDESSRALVNETNAKIAAIGMGQQEAAQQLAITKRYEDYAKALRDLTAQRDRGDFAADPSQFERESAALKAAVDYDVQVMRDGYAKMLQAQANWLNGVNSGIEDWMAETANVSAQLSDMTKHGMDTIANSLTEAAETGKFAWRSMLIDMLKELEKFLIKQAMLKAAYAFVNYLGNNYGFQGGTDASTFAKGGVFDNAPDLSKYSGKVVRQPTPFYFAKGSPGIMGEAGPEAIMPLEKGSDGKLGVKAIGGSGMGDIQVNIITTINSDGSGADTKTSSNSQNQAVNEFVERMRSIAKDEINRSLRQGGTLWRAGMGVG